MSMLAGRAFVATGVIEPSRFVSLDTTSGNLNSVIQSVLNDTRVIGVAQPDTEDTPGVQGAQPDAARPGNIAAPALANFTLGSVTTGALAAQTYFVKITWVTAFGETTPSPEASQANLINTVYNVTINGPIPNGVLGVNIYTSSSAGGGSGAETKQNTSLIGTTQVYQEPSTGLIAGASPPSVNTSGFPQQKATLKVYGPGDVCLLRIGAAGVTAGDWMEPDANGQGITASLASATAVYYGAKVLETANAGELALVLVTLGAITGT